MDGNKLRATIRTAMRRVTPAATVEEAADKIAQTIESILEIEAEADAGTNEHHMGISFDPFEKSRKLSSPPMPNMASVIPAPKDIHPAPDEYIPRESPKLMTQEQIEKEVIAIRRSVEDEAPLELDLQVDANNSLNLRRKIDILPGVGVRLSYAIGAETSTAPSTRTGSTTTPSGLGAMAVDAAPSTLISVSDSDRSIRDRIEKIKEIGRFVYRKDKGPVVSRTPIRQGPITLDLSRAPHDDVD